ncbi:MAG TPA: TetR/AcrR family transcriptional regulator [Acidimicrobiales bacterium]|nr:TetR/AcrR family transcriptional regulator [Acidimicrobiales bacterium]
MTAPGRSEPRERILEGTSRAICAAGVRATSLEDIARESGCSRATIYRHFPGGRDELLEALVAFEHGRFFVRLGRAVEDATTLEEVVERGLMVAHRAVVELEVLQIVLREQPELLEPTLARAARPTLRLVAEFLAPYLVAHGVTDPAEAAAYADFLARMVLSYISSPGRWDLDDAAQVRSLVGAELLGGLAALQAAS